MSASPPRAERHVSALASAHEGQVDAQRGSLAANRDAARFLRSHVTAAVLVLLTLVSTIVATMLMRQDPFMASADGRDVFMLPSAPHAAAATSPAVSSSARWAALRSCLARSVNADCAALPHELNTVPAFDDWREHARDVLALAAVVGQHYDVHSYAGYDGPWIENHFIRFVNETWEAWYPVVPIPVQWTDLAVCVGCDEEACVTRLQQADRVWDSLFAGHALRDDYIYATVVQHDLGRPVADGGAAPVEQCHAYRNVLIFSSGGWGNVPIPLIKGDVRSGHQMPLRTSRRRYVLSFTGSTHYGRGALLNALAEAARTSLPREYMYLNDDDQPWKTVARLSVFGLSPRGHGRTAFRAFELLQAGTLAILAYTDVSWLPYASARFNGHVLWGAGGVGLTVQYGQARALMCSMCTLFANNSALTSSFSEDFSAQLQQATEDPTSCMCSAEEWRRVLPRDSDGMFTVHSTSVIALMEERLTQDVVDRFFVYDGVLQRIRDFLRDPERREAGLQCQERPGSFIRRLPVMPA